MSDGISIKSSEDGFERIYQLATDIAIWTNPQLFYNLQDMCDVLEQRAELQRLKEEMGELIG